MMVNLQVLPAETSGVGEQLLRAGGRSTIAWSDRQK